MDKPKNYIIFCASHIASVQRLNFFKEQIESIGKMTILPNAMYIGLSYEQKYVSEVEDFIKWCRFQKISIVFVLSKVKLSQFQHYNSIINTCFSQEQEKYVLFVDDDDQCFPKLAEKELNLIRTCDHVICLDNPAYIGDEDNFLGVEEMHGSMGKLSILKDFCTKYKDLLMYGMMDMSFINYIMLNYKYDDLMEVLYHYKNRDIKSHLLGEEDTVKHTWDIPFDETLLPEELCHKSMGQKDKEVMDLFKL